MAVRNQKAVIALYLVETIPGDTIMNPFEKAEFRSALEKAFVDTIKKVGLGHFKRISWFASNEKAQDASKAA
jgi:hypothetical protein